MASCCRNKLCKLFSKTHKMHCSSWKLGAKESFINWCPMRTVYIDVARRLSHEQYMLKNKDKWNTYQKARRQKNGD